MLTTLYHEYPLPLLIGNGTGPINRCQMRLGFLKQGGHAGDLLFT